LLLEAFTRCLIVDRSSAQYDIQPNLRGCIYEGKKDTS
jgi:hypothetical protein